MLGPSIETWIFYVLHRYYEIYNKWLTWLKRLFWPWWHRFDLIILNIFECINWWWYFFFVFVLATKTFFLLLLILPCKIIWQIFNDHIIWHLCVVLKFHWQRSKEAGDWEKKIRWNNKLSLVQHLPFGNVVFFLLCRRTLLKWQNGRADRREGRMLILFLNTHTIYKVVSSYA